MRKKTLKEGKWIYKTIHYYYDNNNEHTLRGPNYYKTDLIIKKLEHNFYNAFLPEMPSYKVLINLQNLSKGNTFFTAINSNDDRNYTGYPVKINKYNQITEAEGFDISSSAFISNGTKVTCASKILMTWISNN
jgi:hypothetical protein